MTTDVILLHFLNSFAFQSRVLDTLIIFLASYLQYLLIIIFILLLFLSSYQRKKKLRIFWVTTASIIISRLGVTGLIRFFYHRPRPFLVYRVHQLISDNDWSFPSGHSAFFFAMAATIYFYNKKWGIGFLTASILMNVSRIVAGVHYPSDILVGILIGVATAYIIFYLAEKRNKKETVVYEE